MNGDLLVYAFSIETTCKSEAKSFLKIIKVKDIVFGEHYKTIYKIKNESDKIFPGGSVLIQILYQSDVFHERVQQIGRIEKGGTVTIKDDILAVGVGCAMFQGKITADDNEPVKIIGDGRDLLDEEPFHAIFIRTWTDLHIYYALLATILSLVLIIFLFGVQLFLVK